MVPKTVRNPSFWFALILLLVNGLGWAYALAPEGPAVFVEPRLVPSVATLRERLIEGGASGEPFTLEITDQEAAETIAWYLSNHPDIPFGEPQVFIRPDGISARGTAEIAGLRVGLSGKVNVELRNGVPIVTLRDLDVAGVAVPGLVRDQIQTEIDAQFSQALNLPLVIDDLVLETGKATVRGTIR
jgi:hypothetical protein